LIQICTVNIVSKFETLLAIYRRTFEINFCVCLFPFAVNWIIFWLKFLIIFLSLPSYLLLSFFFFFFTIWIWQDTAKCDQTFKYTALLLVFHHFMSLLLKRFCRSVCLSVCLSLGDYLSFSNYSYNLFCIVSKFDIGIGIESNFDIENSIYIVSDQISISKFQASQFCIEFRYGRYACAWYILYGK